MSEYFNLMARRKRYLFQGNKEKAAELLRKAEKLIDQGEVTDEEIQAAAYI